MRNEWRNSKELEDKHAFFYTVDREEVWIAKLNYTFYGMRCGFCKIKRVFRFLTQASLQVKVQDNLSEMFFFLFHKRLMFSQGDKFNQNDFMNPWPRKKLAMFIWTIVVKIIQTSIFRWIENAWVDNFVKNFDSSRSNRCW